MPGFKVDGVGVGPSSLVKAYLSYNWFITNIFGKQLDETSSDAMVYLESCALPTFTVGKETYQGSSLVYKMAKSVDWDDVRVSWYDTDGLLAVMKQWRTSVWDQATGIASPSEYKRDSEIRTTLPDGTRENSWKLINSWPSVIRSGELTYAQSSAKVVEVTITYDWAEETPA